MLFARPTNLKHRQHQAGFTIVELLIYMGLFGGFLVLLSGLFVSTIEVQQESIDTARIEQDSHYLLSRIQYDVGQANSVTTPATNGATSNTLVMSTSAGTQTYFVEDQQLKMTLGADTNVLTSPDVQVTSLTFQRLGTATGNPSLQINLSIQSLEAATAHREERSYVYTVGLR